MKTLLYYIVWYIYMYSRK